MDIKIDLTNAHVNEGDLVEVFGPKCNYKLTNLCIHSYQTKVQKTSIINLWFSYPNQ